MPVLNGYFPKEESILQNESVVFTGKEVPSIGLAALHFSLSGTTDISHIKRIRAKSGGASMVDIDPTHLYAYIQAESKGNIVVDTSGQHLTVPFYNLALNGDDRYASQFPAGQTPVVEIEFDGTATEDGGVSMGWTEVEGIRQTAFPMFISESHKIDKSSNLDVWKVSRPGLIRGFTFPTVGVVQIELKLSAKTLLRLSGELLQECQRMENSQDLTISDPVYYRLHEPMPATTSGSSVEFKTDGSFDDAGEIGTFSFVPVQ